MPNTITIIDIVLNSPLYFESVAYSKKMIKPRITKLIKISNIASPDNRLLPACFCQFFYRKAVRRGRRPLRLLFNFATFAVYFLINIINKKILARESSFFRL